MESHGRIFPHVHVSVWLLWEKESADVCERQMAYGPDTGAERQPVGGTEKVLSGGFRGCNRTVWKNGEKIYYKGDEFSIIRKYIEIPKINIEIEETKKEIIISVPKNIEQNIIKTYVDKMIKNIFKNNTEELIAKRLPYWSKITGLKYNKFEIRDATTRFGSCMPSTKNVYFSSRLIMLAVDKVDAIIVHELCHMKYKYHNNDFYGLVSKYISNYKEIDTWLKKNSEVIMF